MPWYNGGLGAGVWTGLGIWNVADIMFYCARALNQREAAIGVTKTVFKTNTSDQSWPALSGRSEFVGMQTNGADVKTNLVRILSGIQNLLGQTHPSGLFVRSENSDIAVTYSWLQDEIFPILVGGDRVQHADLWNSFREMFDLLIYLKWDILSIGGGFQTFSSDHYFWGPFGSFNGLPETEWEGHEDFAWPNRRANSPSISDSSIVGDQPGPSTMAAGWYSDILEGVGPNPDPPPVSDSTVVASVFSGSLTIATGHFTGTPTSNVFVSYAFIVDPQTNVTFSASFGGHTFSSAIGKVEQGIASIQLSSGADTVISVVVNSSEPEDIPWDDNGEEGINNKYINMLGISGPSLPSVGWTDLSSILTDQ